MSSRRAVVVITDIFPPVAAVGHQRTVGLCRHLVDNDWNVSVVTMKPRLDVAFDQTLLSRVPSSVRVIKTASPDLPRLAQRLVGHSGGDSSSGAVPGAPPSGGAASGGGAAESADEESSAAGQGAGRDGTIRRLLSWLSWWLVLPDSRTSWLPTAVPAVAREARRIDARAIFSTAPCFSSHLVARAAAGWLRLPWVADFRDPWCGNDWRTIPPGLHTRAEELLERIVVRRADRITCAFDGINRHLDRRYAKPAGSISTIHNGFEARDLDDVPAEALRSDRCVLVHAGSLYGPRSPMPVLDALAALRRQKPELAQRLLVLLVGSPTWNDKPVAALAAERRVEDLVHIMPTVQHGRAVALVKGASAGILFGQGGGSALAPVPAKAFEYVGMGKPVLSIGSGREAEDILRDGGCTVWSASAEAESCSGALEQIARAHQTGSLCPAAGPGQSRERYSRQAMAIRIEEVIEQAIAARAGKRRKSAAAFASDG